MTACDREALRAWDNAVYWWRQIERFEDFYRVFGRAYDFNSEIWRNITGLYGPGATARGW